MQKGIVFVTLFILFSSYSVIVYTSGTKGSNHVMNERAIEGKRIFQKYNCTACHQLYGLGGYLGPELTVVLSEPGKGEPYARAILKSGTQRMPDFHLQDEEVEDIIEFLKYVEMTATTYKAKI